MKVKFLALALSSACILSAAPFGEMGPNHNMGPNPNMGPQMNADMRAECLRGDIDCPNFNKKGPRGGKHKKRHYGLDPIVFNNASYEQKLDLVKSFYAFELQHHKQNSSKRQEILKLEEKLELARIELDELKRTNADNNKISKTLATINTTQNELRKIHEELRSMRFKALDEKTKRDNKILGY